MSKTVVVAQRMWQRRDTAANWDAKNPVLAAGEIGVELGSNPPKFKIGDGSLPWTDLTYAGGGADGKSAYEVAVENGFIGTEAEWLASLQGDPGPQGLMGAQGPAADGSFKLTLPASEPLYAGALVNIHDVSGQAHARLASASQYGFDAHGFVLDAVGAEALANVSISGSVNTALSGLVPGHRYVLARVAGGVEPAADAGDFASGQVIQFVGEALSANALHFTKSLPPIVLE